MGDLYLQPSTAEGLSPPLGIWTISEGEVFRLFAGTWMACPLDKPTNELERDYKTGRLRAAGDIYGDPKFVYYQPSAFGVFMHDPRWRDQKTPTLTVHAVMACTVDAIGHSWYSHESGVIEYREGRWTCSSVSQTSFTMQLAAAKDFKKRTATAEAMHFVDPLEIKKLITSLVRMDLHERGQALPVLLRDIMLGHEAKIDGIRFKEMKKLEAQGLDLTDEQMALVLRRKRQEKR